MPELNFNIYFMKTFFISIFTYSTFLKINDIKFDKKIDRTILVSLMAIIIAAMFTIIKYKIGDTVVAPISYVVYSFSFAIITKNKIGYSMLVTIISLGLNYILYFLSISIAYIPSNILKISNDFINFSCIIGPIYGGLVYLFFKNRRLKRGFVFLQSKGRSDNIDIFILSISAVGLFIYFCIDLYDMTLMKYVVIQLMLVTAIMIIVIQKTFTMYYKQIQTEKIIEEQAKEIEEKNREIEKISSEKLNIMKISHQFYNRQEALELKVKELINNKSLNTEIGEELSVIDRISSISKEYAESMQALGYKNKLPSTNVDGIDDIFKYMQLECEKHKIKFNLQLNGSVNYMINNIISQNKLETLIGDHIRDAIIAINSNESENKSIIAKLGIINNCYEFSVYDTGIEFEIDTLIKLGLEPVTTHKKQGGSGLGFITTFEFLKEHNASLAIEEKKVSNVDYTKVVRIVFDNKNEYRICSYRANEIQKRNKENRTIIIKTPML